MGIAALVIGILSVILGFVPLCNYFALIPAVVGLILGIIDVKQKTAKQQPKGMGLAGIILNVIAIVVILLWTLVFAAAGVAGAGEMENIQQQIEESMRETGTPELPDEIEMPEDTE